MPIVIDNDTGSILSGAVSKLQARHERIADYNRAMSDLLDPRNAPQPGGPWCEMSVEDRIEAMFEAKYGGAYADAVAGWALGYATGDIPG